MFTRIKAVLLATLTLSLAAVFLSPSANAQAVAKCAGQAATIVGTTGDDVLRGTPRRDIIVGNGGNDRIFGAGGNDIICGNAGDDHIQGGPGADVIIGGYGNDRIIGGDGHDDLRGGRGDDYISGKSGRDRITGEQGADRIAGNLGADTCTVQNIDTQITSCEAGNSTTVAGVGDAVARPTIPDSFSVARYCFAGSRTRCDDYYVARVDLDGSGSFDALGIRAFDANGNTIATYSGVGDTYGGAFMFRGKPAAIEVDSGGGVWSISFVNRTGLPLKRAATRGAGNEVYRVSNKVKNFTETTATWNGYGNFAVIGVSPTRGRDLMVNEVRFAGGSTPPFSTTSTAQSGITVVQVLSNSGTWTVRLGS